MFQLFTFLRELIPLDTQQLGFEGLASKFCFGSYIKISFRQDIYRVVEVLGSATL
jgi:hypothetical protein